MVGGVGFSVSLRERGGGPTFKHSEAFSFQVATDTQEQTDRHWDAIVGNGGEESACDWCPDRWGISWQITPRILTGALPAGGDEARNVARLFKLRAGAAEFGPTD